MFVVMNRLQVPADYAEHLERAFAHAGKMDGVQGCTGFQFLKRLGDGAGLEYVAVTTWTSQADFERWLKSEGFQRAHQGAGSPVTSVSESYEVLS